MKVLIVECDVPIDALKAQFGSYEAYFKTLLLTAGATNLETDAVAAYDGETLPKDVSGYDGVLFSGSRHNSYDDTPWILETLEFIREVYKRRVKMVGICFGHQIIARALGGQVGVNPAGWEIAVTTTKMNESIPEFAGSEMRLQQMHRDYVSQVPPIDGLIVFASNENCKVQGIFVKDKLLSVQGHPEFNQLTVETLIKSRVDLGIVPEDYGRDAMARAGLEHDGIKFAKTIIKFFS